MPKSPKAYPKIRMPRIGKKGGAHLPEKGGKYRRSKERKKVRKELEIELK